MTENEVDHVLVGYLNDENFQINPEEVKAYRWISIENLKKEMCEHPHLFTPWLKQALQLVEDTQ